MKFSAKIIFLLTLQIFNTSKISYIDYDVCKCNGIESPAYKCKEPAKSGEICGPIKTYGQFNNMSDEKQICLNNELNPKLIWCNHIESIIDIYIDREKSGEKPSPEIVKTNCDFLNPLISAKLSLDVYNPSISKFPDDDHSKEMEEIYIKTGCRLSLFKKLTFDFTRFTSINIYAFTSKQTIYNNVEGYIISIKGTDMNSTTDVISDIQILFNQSPLLYSKAKETIDNFFKIFPDIEKKLANIVGHSLGGAVAQFLAMGYKSHSTSFDAPGVFRIAQNLRLNPFDGEIQLFTSLPNWVNTFGENKNELSLLLIDQPKDCKILDLSNAILIDEYSSLPKEIPITNEVLFRNYFTFNLSYLLYYHDMKKIYDHVSNNKASIRTKNLTNFKGLNCELHKSGYIKTFYENLLDCFEKKNENFLKIVEELNSKSCN